MKTPPDNEPLSRRAFMRATSVLAATALAGELAGGTPAATAQDAAAAATKPSAPAPRPLLTKAEDFYDVSRGNPKPHTLTGHALTQARLTAETWRLEITADPFTSDVVKEPASLRKQFTLDAGNALGRGIAPAHRFLKKFKFVAACLDGRLVRLP